MNKKWHLLEENFHKKILSLANSGEINHDLIKKRVAHFFSLEIKHLESGSLEYLKAVLTYLEGGEGKICDAVDFYCSKKDKFLLRMESDTENMSTSGFDPLGNLKTQSMAYMDEGRVEVERWRAVHREITGWDKQKFTDRESFILSTIAMVAIDDLKVIYALRLKEYHDADKLDEFQALNHLLDDIPKILLKNLAVEIEKLGRTVGLAKPGDFAVNSSFIDAVKSYEINYEEMLLDLIAMTGEATETADVFHAITSSILQEIKIEEDKDFPNKQEVIKQILRIYCALIVDHKKRGKNAEEGTPENEMMRLAIEGTFTSRSLTKDGIAYLVRILNTYIAQVEMQDNTASRFINAFSGQRLVGSEFVQNISGLLNATILQNLLDYEISPIPSSTARRVPKTLYIELSGGICRYEFIDPKGKLRTGSISSEDLPSTLKGRQSVNVLELKEYLKDLVKLALAGGNKVQAKDPKEFSRSLMLQARNSLGLFASANKAPSASPVKPVTLENNSKVDSDDAVPTPQSTPLPKPV